MLLNIKYNDLLCKEYPVCSVLEYYIILFTEVMYDTI